MLLFPFCYSKGGSCRTRVTKFLAREFKTLSEAEEALQIDYVRSSVAFEERSIFEERARSTPKKTVLVDDACLSPIFSCSPSKGAEQSVGDVVRQFLMYFKSSMSSRLRTQLLQHIFKLSVLQEHGIDFFKFINSDFLNVSLGAMKTLFTEKKHNLIYDLSRCFNGLTTRMPLDRMPFGLIDYNIRFFASNKTQKLGMEDHYSSWLQTMFSQFGHKWLCLHRGPAWQYDEDPMPVQSVQNTLDHSSAADNEEIDIIQSALQQSSLSLDLEESSVSLELSSTMSGCSGTSVQYSNPQNSSSAEIEEDQCLSPLVEENVIPSPEPSDGVQVAHLPHLWTHASSIERQEVELGLLSPQEMERLHSIRPTGVNNANRNPWMFDPLKVCYKSLISVYVSG